MKRAMKILSVAILLTGSVAFAQEADHIVVNQLDDRLHEVALFHDNGMVMEKGLMVDGRFDGTWTRYNREGMVTAIASYRNGLKDGVWQIFNNEGTMIYELVYENNERLIARSFDGAGGTVAYRIR